jgi:hypothetical protein
VSHVTDVIDRQIEAYVNRDLASFLAYYASEVQITDFNGNLLMGLDGMREQYGVLFRDSPNLTARIGDRMVVGDVVIDEEEVHGANHPDYPPDIHAAVAYHVSGEKIDRVVFLSVEESKLSDRTRRAAP